MHARATCFLLSEQNDYNNNNNIRCMALSLAAAATGGMQPQPRLRAQPGPRIHRARSRDRCPPRDLQRKSVSQRTARFRMYEQGKCIPCAPLNIRQELLGPFSKDARPRVAVFTRHFRFPTVFPPVEIVFLRCRQAKAEAGHSVKHFEATLLPCSSTAIIFLRDPNLRERMFSLRALSPANSRLPRPRLWWPSILCWQLLLLLSALLQSLCARWRLR